MLEPNKNFIIFLILFVLSFSLPKFQLLFRAKLLFMLFILLVAFSILSSRIKFHISTFLGHLLTITTLTPSSSFLGWSYSSFMLLITFSVLSSRIKFHMSTFLGHLLSITTFTPAYFVLPILFLFNRMSITNLSLNLDFVAFLAMVKLKRGIGVTILSLIVFVSPTMLSFRNIFLCQTLSLLCLPIYILCLRSFSRWATYSLYSCS